MEGAWSSYTLYMRQVPCKLCVFLNMTGLGWFLSMSKLALGSPAFGCGFVAVRTCRVTQDCGFPYFPN